MYGRQQLTCYRLSHSAVADMRCYCGVQPHSLGMIRASRDWKVPATVPISEVAVHYENLKFLPKALI
jgi:hypothetical protein